MCDRVAIPALVDGLLPTGIHPCTLNEIEATFGSLNATRQQRFADLSAFLATVTSWKLFHTLLVDGSFSTDKVAPGDVDAILLLPANRLFDLMSNPQRMRAVEHNYVKATFRVDLYTDHDRNGNWTQLFQSLKAAEALQRKLPPSRKRGILEVTL